MGLFDIFKKKAVAPQKTFICARCKKEIADEESKWIGNHRFCCNCATPIKAQPLTVTAQKDLCKKRAARPLASTFEYAYNEYAYKVVAISHKLYAGGNCMAYFMLLNGLGLSKVEVRPGAGHNHYLVVDAIHSYQKDNPNMNVKDGYVEGIKTSIALAENANHIARIFNYLNYEVKLKKDGINIIEIDIAYFLEQLISAVTEKQAQFEEKMSDFQEWFDKQVEHIKKTMDAIPLPKVLQDMSFNIVIKKGGIRLPDGCILEKFYLYKENDDIIRIFWSVGFGYSMLGHNPGAGGNDIVPAEYFINHDLSGFATYISNKYKDIATYDEIYNNSEIQTLFELLALDSEK